MVLTVHHPTSEGHSRVNHPTQPPNSCTIRARANRAVVVVSAALVGAGLVVAALIVSGNDNDNTTTNTPIATAPPTTTLTPAAVPRIRSQPLPITTAPPTTTLIPAERHGKIEELEDCRAALDAVIEADAEAPRRMNHALAMADIAASGGWIGPSDPVYSARWAITAAETLYGGIAEALAPQIAAHKTFIERCTGVASPDAFESIESSLSYLHTKAADNRRRCIESAENLERMDAEMATDEFTRADKYEREYPDNPDLAALVRAFARKWQQAAAMSRAWMDKCP